MDTDGLPTPRRYWSAATIAMALFMTVLDSSIANVALPTIARDLHTTAAGSVWVVNAYQMAIVVCLLPLASLGELAGYRRVYRWGIAIFTLSSIGCALSTSLPALAAARMAQGVGAAGIMSMNGALVRHTYPQAKLGRGIAINSMVLALAAALGPTLASAILAVGSWQWLFAVNGPIGVLVLAGAVMAAPRSERAQRPFDFVAAGLNALAFGPLIAGIDTLTRGGAPLPAGLAIAAGLIASALLIRRSLGQRQPLVPIDLLRIRAIRFSAVTSVVCFIGQMSAFVALPFLLQHGLGRSAVETGLLMTPWPLAVGVVSPLAGRLSDRFSAGWLGAIGLSVFAVGLACLAFMPAHPTDIDIGWRMAVCGLGFGIFQSPNNRTLMAAAPRERLGSAGGLLATARLAGQTAGASLTAFLFHLGFQGRGASTPLLFSAACALTAAVVSAFRIKDRPSGPAGPAEALAAD